MPEYDGEALAPALRSIAVEAAKLLREARAARHIKIYQKEDGSPVTDGDLEVDRLLRDRLRAVDPSIPYVSEEDEDESWGKGEKPIYWLADPIDATGDYIRGGSSFTVNVALIVEGRPIMGMVACPMKREVYYTSASGGACKYNDVTGEEVHLEEREENDAEDVRVLIPRAKPEAEAMQFLHCFYGRRDMTYITVPGSLKLALLAEGRAHCYPRLTNTARCWDVAAGHAILRAAGGAMLAGDGAELRYSLENINNPPFVAFSAGSANRACIKKYYTYNNMVI